jgi:hypothetical protein
MTCVVTLYPGTKWGDRGGHGGTGYLSNPGATEGMSLSFRLGGGTSMGTLGLGMEDISGHKAEIPTQLYISQHSYRS